jgi:hypothetical protein
MKLRRIFVFAGLLALVSGFGLATFIAIAQCTPTPGTGSGTNDVITCSGDDADGVNTGSGNDTVNVVSGTVMDTILNEGGTLVVVINGGVVDTSVAGTGAIAIDGDGNISVQGDVRSGLYTIIVIGNGNITSIGNLLGTLGIQMDGNGNVTSIGNVTATDASGIGIFLGGTGTILSTGNISGGSFGIFVGGGTVTSTGNVSGGLATGIFINGSGDVISTGNLSGGQFGVFINSDGSITSTGNVTGGTFGMFLNGNGTITSNGNVSGGIVSGIFLNGNGAVNSTGDVSGGNIGIYMDGDGTITSDGSITATQHGIQGGNGSQQIDVSGSINAPIAVFAGEGNDTLHIHESTEISGIIRMEGGDDTVQIGDNAVVPGTVFGGETAEVNGDVLIIGSDQVCGEDGQAVANAQAVNTLDPNGGSVVYLGQTYTWAEFEQIMGGEVVRCFGFIDDGRINAYDLGAPDALYCTVDKGVSVWEIDLQGKGTFSFAISAAQIQEAVALAVSSGVNQMFAEDAFGNQFYALSDGQHITFVAPELREPGKTYQFMFDKGRCA